MTVFDRIEKLKRDYTDKYVVVDRSRPELMRFRQRTGQVKTVNMSGRALVEFNGHNDIGWYDIEIDFLKVVDKPDESDSKPAAKKAPKKPLAEKEPSPLEKARAEKAGGKPKMSTADILAAARAKKEAAAPASQKPSTEKPSTEKPSTVKASTVKASTVKPSTVKAAANKGGKMSTADILAAARAGKSAGPSPAAASEPQAAGKPAPKASPAKTDRSKMSTADILAAARAAKAVAQETAEAETPEIETPEAENLAVKTPATEKPAQEQAASVESPTPVSVPAGDLPTDTAGIIAYCRQQGGS